MRIDKYGKPIFKKLITSGAANGDSIEKVAIYNDYSFAVGYSLIGSYKTYFLMRITVDGVVDYKIQVGADNTKVANNSVIVDMHAISDTVVQISFQGSISGTSYDVFSVVTLGTTSTEKYIGLYNQYTMLWLSMFESGGNYTLLGIRSGYLFELVFNSLNSLNSKARNVFNSQSFYSDPTRNSIDFDSARSNGVFSLAYTGSSQMYTFSFTSNPGGYSNFYYLFNYNYRCNVYNVLTNYVSSSSALNMYNCASDSLYLDVTTMGSSTTYYKGISFKREHKTTSTKLTSKFVYATSQVGAESGASAKQGVIWKRLDSSLDWSPYN